MPKLSHQQEDTIRRAIRDAYAVDPLLTEKRLMEILEKRFNKSFDYRYIVRLKNKVGGEMLPRLDKEKVETALMKLRETYRIAREDLIVIAYGQGTVVDGKMIDKTSKKDRIAAWRAILVLEKMKMDIEIDLGIYNKEVDSKMKEDFRWRPLPPEIRDSMVETAKLWELPTNLTRQIDPEQAIDVQSVDSPVKVDSVAQPKEQQANNHINEPAKPITNNGIVPDPELQLS